MEQVVSTDLASREEAKKAKSSPRPLDASLAPAPGSHLHDHRHPDPVPDEPVVQRDGVEDHPADTTGIHRASTTM